MTECAYKRSFVSRQHALHRPTHRTVSFPASNQSVGLRAQSTPIQAGKTTDDKLLARLSDYRHRLGPDKATFTVSHKYKRLVIKYTEGGVKFLSQRTLGVLKGTNLSQETSY